MNKTADKLYPHNRQAYEKVMEHFADHRRAAVIQPTGTGKSYLAGAVASHFGRVLIVAPNDYVLAQASVTTPHGECVTYSWLSQQNMMPRGYDLIWFDEFHRIGAEVWSKGVTRLIEANTEAKILGTTATEERALEQRNMADEMFSGDVVSHMTLSDAWAKGILRAPTYVIGVVSMDDTHKDYKEKINHASRLNDTQKSKANAMLDNLVRDWSRSAGIPRILHKYIVPGVQRMIVFTQTINKLADVKTSLPQWFKGAGLKLANVYEVHSALGKEAKENMRAFEQDNSEGIKVLLSVDMLNEGIHVEGVDACMLLRSTISKNLYLQQIGRCFSVGQKHKPVILDLADNITSACGYDGIYEARDRFYEAGTYKELNHSKWADDFLVVDTLKTTRELMSELDNIVFDRRTFNEKLAELASWCEEHGRFPGNIHTRIKDMDDEQKLETRLLCFASYNKDSEPIIALRKRYLKWTYLTMEQKVQAVIEFVDANGRLPVGKRKLVTLLTEEERMERNLNCFVYRFRSHPVIAKLLDAFRAPSFDEMFTKVEQFIHDNGRLPRGNRKLRAELATLPEEKRYERSLADFLTNNRNDERIITLRKKYNDVRSYSIKEKRRLILEWCERHGTYPICIRNDNEQSRYAAYIRNCRDEEFIAVLRERYGYRPFTERVKDRQQELIDFCESHGRLPHHRATDPEEKRFRDYYETACKRQYDFIIPLREQYLKRKVSPRRSREEKIELVVDFITTNKRLPRESGKGIIKGEGKVRACMDKVRDDPQIASLIERYSCARIRYHAGKKVVLEEMRIQQLREFVQEHGYLPAHKEDDRKCLEHTIASYFSFKRKKKNIPEVEEIYATYPTRQQYSAQQNRLRLIEHIRQHGKPSAGLTATDAERSLRDIFQRLRNDADVIEALTFYESSNN